MQARTLAFLALIAVAPSAARADAIGIPDCPPGGAGVPNPHHGTGWCAAAPCTTDADCPTLPPIFGGPVGPRVCRALGLCVWGDRQDAIGACEVDGATCTAPGYPPEGATCRVRSYCVEASRAPAPSAAPAPRPGLCAASPARAPLGAWMIALVSIAALARGKHRAA